MLTLKKSLIILGINILAIASSPFIFAWAITMPLWPGAAVLLFSLAWFVLTGIKLWGSVGDVRIELYKRNGMQASKTRQTLKALRKARRQARNDVFNSTQPTAKEHAFKQLIRAEERIAEIKGLAYEAPEDFRG
jgi:hypothetical protein